MLRKSRRASEQRPMNWGSQTGVERIPGQSTVKSRIDPAPFISGAFSPMAFMPGRDDCIGSPYRTGSTINGSALNGMAFAGMVWEAPSAEKTCTCPLISLLRSATAWLPSAHSR